MKFRELSIPGAVEVTPQQPGDPRGLFMEWYRVDHLAAELGQLGGGGGGRGVGEFEEPVTLQQRRAIIG